MTRTVAGSRKRPRTVLGELERWLPGSPVGVDAVRAQLARRLASEIDDKGAPRYALSKVSAELRAVLAEMADVETGPPTINLERLLREAVRW